VEGVNVIWQDAIPVVPVALRVQLPALPKWPEVGEAVKLTVPVGVLAPLDWVSVTIAAQVVAVPVLTERGVQAREVADVALDVVSCPVSSIAVHSSAETHAIAFRTEFGSMVVGVGVPGLAGFNVTLLAEFTISFDRRDSDFELQVQRQRYAALDSQVHRVDELSKRTNIVATNQMFKLGIDLYQVRFVADPEADLFRDEAKYLGEALRLTDAVEVFLASPYLQAADGLPPPGQDPFPPLKAAVQLLYPEEAVEALMAGSIASTIMHTAGRSGGLTGPKGEAAGARTSLSSPIRSRRPRPIRNVQRSVFNATHPINTAENAFLNTLTGSPRRRTGGSGEAMACRDLRAPSACAGLARGRLPADLIGPAGLRDVFDSSAC
jgi:hypothetical protein